MLSLLTTRRLVRVRLGLVIIALLLVAACRRVSVGEIPGRYTVKYSFGTEVLVIVRNGTYTQIVNIGNDAPLERAGTWTYDQGSGKITLEDHIMVHDGYGQLDKDVRDPKNRWGAVLAVRKDWSNRLTIGAGAEGYDFAYRKQAP